MMSISEYASDINKTVEQVLAKCKLLNINASNEDDMLGEEDIINLDNLFTKEDNVEKLSAVSDERVEEIISKSKIDIDDSIKQEKLKSKQSINKEDYAKKKSEFYKLKEKLTKNVLTKEDNIIIYEEEMIVGKLAKALGVSGSELVSKLMDLGVIATLNNVISFDDAELLVVDYNKELKRKHTQDEVNFEKLEITDDAKNLVVRPPVVTIMGHVDHGKTTLLDKIRKSNVVEKEVGGITQYIGAYQIEFNNQKVTFIDTPGHAAFTEMRARGASITDIVVIVIAADDGVKPQTKEAIDHAKIAEVPILVVINKIDKKEASVEKIMTEMSDYGLTPEEWGGNTIFTTVSAITGEGLSQLLENILLVSELEELKANPKRYAMGTVIEAKLNKNTGSTATLIIQNGTLRLGDPIVVGNTYGKVRTLKDALGNNLLEALPSTPVEITGINDVPTAGDKFMAFETEKQARNIAETRKSLAKRKKGNETNKTSLEDLFNKVKSGAKEIKVIIKADTRGSEEALKKALEKITIDNIRVNVIRSSTGTITESDIILANVSAALVLGFNVKPSNKTLELAKNYNVDIRLHNIIYKVIEELETAVKGLLEPVYEEKILGQAEVRKLFKSSKLGTIAGSYVTNGIIKTNSKARIIRDGIIIYDGLICSIQREKDVVKETKQGFECGIVIENYNDLKTKDIIESYEDIEIKG